MTTKSDEATPDMKPQWKSEIRTRLAGLHLAPTREAAIVEELAQYLEDCYAELLAGGASRAEAYEQALAELSGSEFLTRELRRMERQVSRESITLGTNRRTKMIADLWQDLRYGARMLVKQPGFTLIAVLTLSLGIGANTAIFSLLDALLLKTLPVRQPEQLVFVEGLGFAYPDPVFPELSEKNSSFAGMFSFNRKEMTVSDGKQAERVIGELVSGNFFNVLGVGAHLGRVFSDVDDQTPGGHLVTVISYNYWRRRFGADPNIVGRKISVNNYPFTIIGVAAQGFND